MVDEGVLIAELSTAGAVPIRTSAIVTRGSQVKLWRNPQGGSWGVWNKLKSAFLPEDYPGSVTTDYMPFQMWDTLQGLSTYIRSMLSTQALLSGIGVGETTASVIGATFQWFLRDFTGMLGGILFTLYQGSNLDSNAKKWRLAADFLNDMGMLMDLISPLFPHAFLAILCVGSIARSITGVASGSTRAALTQHFALRQNAADVSAKEGSQETAATLLGMLLGMMVARMTSGHAVAIWASFLFLTAFHMYANYRAVRSLCLTSLNPERAAIVLQEFLAHDTVPTPGTVSQREKIFPQFPSPSSLWKGEKSRRVVFGSRVSSLTSKESWKVIIPMLIRRYGRGGYLLANESCNINVIVHLKATAQDCLRGYMHALHLAANSRMGAITEAEEMQSLLWMEESFPRFLHLLDNAGWATHRILSPHSEWRAIWPDSKSD